jgi:hypothetical protein
MQKFMKSLSSTFQIKYHEPSCCVGMEITRDRSERTITISQEGFIRRMLERYGMMDCKPVKSPGDPVLKLSKVMDLDSGTTQKDLEDKMSRIPYRAAVGSLNYLSCISRPDISFSVSQVAKFCNYPTPSHWTAVKRIFRYLRGTLSFRLKYTSGSTGLTGFCDADWASNHHESTRSTSGFIFTLNGGPVSWSSTSQKLTAQSSTEAECIAAVEAMKEVLWLRPLLEDLGCRQQKPTVINVDNQASIALSRNPMFTKTTKYISVRYNRIREEQEAGTLELNYVPTTEQPADMLTKSLGGQPLSRCLEVLDIRPRHE